MTKSKELVSYSWKPLSPEASTFPHTHTHNVLREHREPSAHLRTNKPFTLPNYSYQSSGYQQSIADYQEWPINFLRPDYATPPTKVQETYHVYCMNDHANHVARRAYEKGWISRARVKKIFHRGLEESFEGYRDWYLPPLYLNNMINYGKFYKYLSRC